MRTYISKRWEFNCNQDSDFFIYVFQLSALQIISTSLTTFYAKKASNTQRYHTYHLPLTCKILKNENITTHIIHCNFGIL
jgi:hypothetical protein